MSESSNGSTALQLEDLTVPRDAVQILTFDRKLCFFSAYSNGGRVVKRVLKKRQILGLSTPAARPQGLACRFVFIFYNR